MGWKITWGDHTLTDLDATGRHAALVVLQVGEDTWDISPTGGPVRLMAWLVAMVALADDRVAEIDAVREEIATSPWEAIVGSITVT